MTTADDDLGTGAFTRVAVRALAGVAARGARRLAVLIFHRVTPVADPLFPHEMHARRFDATMGALAAAFNVLPLADGVARMAAGTLPRRAVAITFDDGYADNHGVALPILARHRLPATFFVASGFLDGGIMWNDEAIEAIRTTPQPALALGFLGLPTLPTATDAERVDTIGAVLGKLKYLAPDQRRDALAQLAAVARAPAARGLMMTSEQVRSLARAGMEVGGHTVHHPILAVLPSPEAQREIVADRARLSDILGAPPRLFAYPNGKPGVDYLPEHAALARAAGYSAAFSTRWGTGGRETDAYEIPRFTPWDQAPGRFLLRLAHNYARR